MPLTLQAFTDSSIPPIVLIVLYFIATMLTIANYVAYVRYHNDIYGADFVRTYLAFTILGTATYAIISGVCWTWAAKYVTTSEERFQKIAIGLISIFAIHDLPIFAMDWHMVLCCGWRNGFQGFCFVKQILFFMLSFTFGWTMYTYTAAGYAHKLYGEPAELKTGTEMIGILPTGGIGGGASDGSPMNRYEGGEDDDHYDNGGGRGLGYGPGGSGFSSGVGWKSPAAFGDRSLQSPLLPTSKNVQATFVDQHGDVRWNAGDGRRPDDRIDPYAPRDVPPVALRSAMEEPQRRSSVDREEYQPPLPQTSMNPIDLSAYHLTHSGGGGGAGVAMPNNMHRGGYNQQGGNNFADNYSPREPIISQHTHRRPQSQGSRGSSRGSNGGGGGIRPYRGGGGGGYGGNGGGYGGGGGGGGLMFDDRASNRSSQQQPQHAYVGSRPMYDGDRDAFERDRWRPVGSSIYIERSQI